MTICTKDTSYDFNCSYLYNKKIGSDLFLKNQIILNPRTDTWIELSVHSKIFLKICIKEQDFFYPSEHIIISKDKLTLSKKDVRLKL